MTESLRGLDERHDRLVIGDRGIPIVDEEAGGRFEADRTGGDGQVSQVHLRLQRPTRPDTDEGGPFRDRQDLGHDDLDVVGADPGRDDRDPLTSKRPGDRGELPVLVLELDGIEARCDPGGSIRVAGEEDVLGQVSRSESDVVLPFPFWDRYPAISRAIDAGFRVRQDLSLAHVAASLARNSAEDRPLFVRESSVAERG